MEAAGPEAAAAAAAAAKKAKKEKPKAVTAYQVSSPTAALQLLTECKSCYICSAWCSP